MARIGIVKPDVQRLALAEGDWIEVKKFLAVGEKKRLEGAGVSAVRTANADTRTKQSFELDYERLTLARIEAYVVKWSFTDLEGNTLKVNPENISALTPEIATEIDEALDKHIEAMTAAKKAEEPVGAGATS